MWWIWPHLRRLWAAACTLTAGLLVSYLSNLSTRLPLPEQRIVWKFLSHHRWWLGSALMALAVASVFAERGYRRFEARAPRPLTIRRGSLRERLGRILGRHAPEPKVVAAAAGSSIMVGREAELTRLGDWFAQVKSGKRRVVFVAGEPGIGKTALVGAFINSIARNGEVRIGQGQCVEDYGAGEPYMPLLEALTRLCREPRGKQLVKILHRLAPTWLAQMPTLISAEDRTRLQGHTQEATQQRMLREIAEAMDAITLERPLVLVLEDLHWSDPSTLQFIAAIARRAEPARLLLLGTYRPIAMLANDHPLRATKHELELHGLCEELSLNLLGEADVTAYLEQRLAESAAEQSWERIAPAIYAQSEGNPLFMINVADYMVAQGPSLDASKIQTPRTIQQMIERNLERLNPDEQAVLKGASVVGAEFSAVEVAAALERPQDEVEACLTRLSRREQFVTAKEPIDWPDGTVSAHFRFQHALYQEVLHGLLPPGHRIQFHRRIAMRQEAGYGEQAGEVATELAYHYSLAKDKDKAIQYFQLAGERASARGAAVEAESHYRCALDLLGELPKGLERDRREIRLRVSIGPSLMAVKGQGSSEVGANYTRALELCRLAGDTTALFEALSGLWVFRLLRAELRDADTLAQQLLASVRDSKDDSHVAYANFAAGDTAFWCGQLKSASECLALAIDACRPETRPSPVFVDDPAMISRAYAAWTQHYRGYADQALTTSLDCIRVAQSLSHPRAMAMATIYAGQLHLLRREPDAAIERCRTATSLAEQHGLSFYLFFAQILAGCAAVQRGEGERGVEAIKRGFDAWQGLGSALAAPWFLGEFAAGLNSIGRWDEALEVVRDALRRSEESGERQFAPELHRIAGMALLAQGNLVEAESFLRRAIEIARKQNASMWELRATTSLARLLAKQDKLDEARAMLAAIYGCFTEGFDIADLKDAKALLDELGASRCMTSDARSSATSSGPASPGRQR